MVKFNGEELSKAIEDLAQSIGLRILVKEIDIKEEVMDLVKDGKELLERIKEEQEDASKQLTVSNYKIFGEEVKECVEDLDEYEDSKEKGWAYCFDLDNGYEVTVNKFRKDETLIDLSIDTIAELEELREDGEDYDDVIKKIVKGGNKKW